MTAKKDFKRRVRERQAKTGESYTAARAHVLAQVADSTAAADADEDEATDEPAADETPDEPDTDEAKQSTIPVVELTDVTAEANQLGLPCTVLASPGVVAQVAPTRVLERLRVALLATDEDPQLHLFRAVVLRGEEASRESRRVRGWWQDTKRFFARASVGIGGTNAAGDIMALQVDHAMVIVQLGYVPHMPPISRLRQRVFLTTVDAHTVGGSFLAPY